MLIGIGDRENEDMRVMIREVGKGLHPEEVVVAVRTLDRTEQLAVDRTAVIDSTLEIGWPVGQEGSNFLIELPGETFSGFWRVWVPKDSVLPEREGAKMYA